MSKLAVVDIGTNSIHMVLSEVEPEGSYKVLDRFKDMTRLGDGTFQDRRLSESAMTRGIEVIRNLMTLAHNKGFDHVVATATSAVREARNGGEFLKAVMKQTGLHVRVISGEEEARLIYIGVCHSMDLSDGTSLIADVGGGSVELIACDAKDMLFGKSLKLGAIRLKDRFLKHDPPDKKTYHAMENVIIGKLQTALKSVNSKHVKRIIGTSGMAGNLAEIIYLRRTGRLVPQLNLATVGLSEIRAVEELFKREDLETRLKIPGLDPKRVDTLFPATMVFRCLLEQMTHKKLTISDKAIREGLIFDFIARYQEGIRAEKDIPNVRRRQVLLLARRCQYPEAHSHHVAKLALSLFDQLQSFHGLGDVEREWLEYGAILHDVGYLIRRSQHHKHAYYLITHGDLSSLAAEEIQVIANVARYHRRATPRIRHAAFQALPAQHRKIVQMLSAILRVADALDRSQFSVVRNLQVKIGQPHLFVELECTGDAELEVWAARKRVNPFEKVFRTQVQFITHPVDGYAP